MSGSITVEPTTADMARAIASSAGRGLDVASPPATTGELLELLRLAREYVDECNCDGLDGDAVRPCNSCSLAAEIDAALGAPATP